MARAKQSVIQRDFRFGETRTDMLERHDAELRLASVQEGRNMRILAPGALQARDGFQWRRNQSGAVVGPISISPEANLEFGLILQNTSAIIINETGGTVTTLNPVPWSTADALWIADFGPEIVIGDSTGIWVLEYDDGAWSFEDFAFENGFGNTIAQPYWVFEKGVTLVPNAYSGTVTLTASRGVFNANHVGSRVRYLRREIEVTEYVSPTVIRGTTVEDLPPTFILAVATPADFRVGDVIEGVDTGFQGIIEDITGSNLTVSTLNYFTAGPDTGELIVSSSGTSGSGVAVTSKTTRSTPFGSTVWDEPMISAARGYPQSGVEIGSRLVLCNMPQIPNGIAASSARAYTDFLVGLDDDQAIARQVGDASESIYHAVDAGDLLLMSSRGLYVVSIRDNGVLTPSNFAPVLFDRRGCSPIKPVSVGDGVVFIENNGASVSAAQLSGNVYLKWSVRQLTEMHDHLVNDPLTLCGPSLNSTIPEKYVFVVNSDGTLAAVSFFENLSDAATVGIVPWSTEGEFVSISPVFGSYWAIVDREVDGSTVRMIESLEPGMTVDSAITTSTDPAINTLEVNGEQLEVNGSPLTVNSTTLSHLVGETVYAYSGGFNVGPIAVNSDGFLDTATGLSGERQIGRNFEAWVRPWPVEITDSPRAGTIKQRCIRFLISVQDSDEFMVECNGDVRSIGGFSFGDNLGSAPPRVTDDFAVPVFGRRHNPELYVRKSRPGRLRILYLGQEVQI